MKKSKYCNVWENILAGFFLTYHQLLGRIYPSGTYFLLIGYEENEKDSYFCKWYTATQWQRLTLVEPRTVTGQNTCYGNSDKPRGLWPFVFKIILDCQHICYYLLRYRGFVHHLDQGWPMYHGSLYSIVVFSTLSWKNSHMYSFTLCSLFNAFPVGLSHLYIS